MHDRDLRNRIQVSLNKWTREAGSTIRFMFPDTNRGRDYGNGLTLVTMDPLISKGQPFTITRAAKEKFEKIIREEFKVPFIYWSASGTFVWWYMTDKEQSTEPIKP